MKKSKEMGMGKKGGNPFAKKDPGFGAKLGKGKGMGKGRPEGPNK